MEKKTVVITGAAGVLCSAFAAALAKAGHNVALLDIDLEAAEKVAADINKKGGSAKAYEADVLNRCSLDLAHERISADFGKCGILINGAGGNNPAGNTTHEFFSMDDMSDFDAVTFFDISSEAVKSIVNLNLLGTFIPTQVFAADMIENGGNIINISSMNAFRPLTKIPAYSSAKAAVTNFTQWLAVHFAASKIRVNAIAPGFFVTNQNRSLLYDEFGVATARTSKILNSTPMGRFGMPEELIGTLMWLADDKASGFVTGIIVPVDGGFSAYSGV
ncbi:MAG: SDR family oxidoreductase [Saccharofermentanales bacterium]